VLGIVPDNVVKAAGGSDYLGVLFFGLMMGVGMVMTPGPATQRFKETLQGLFNVSMTLINLIIKLAPYAVFCLMLALAAKFGWDILIKLAKFGFTVLAAIGVHMFIVLPLWVRFMGKMSPVLFFRESQEALLMAFSTASSAATLPTTLRIAEERLKLPPQVSRFVLTIGATANHHGTALFEGVTVLFLAQFFGLTLGLTEQLTVIGLAIVGGIGTAGVPAGSLPVIVMICGIIGIPPEGIAIILGIDRLLDMCRTALNVCGDLATAVVVARASEGDIPVVIPLPEAGLTHGH
jgi:DAACS family dicarboxylate/amino acid:cation (Na+ or H+) symporter